MTCAIHQPNFFPWLGYFHKIAHADVFVFLDAVLYPRNGNRSWTKRVQLLAGGTPCWISPAVKKMHGFEPIFNVEINDEFSWRAELERTLTVNYKRAKHFEEANAVILPLLRFPASNLSEYNIHAVQNLAAILRFPCCFIKQSELNTSAASTELLIEITRKAGCDTYMCGGGASGYQQDELFDESGVTLRYQNFTHPEYPQLGSGFHPGLSIIDTLYNCGVEGVRRLLLP